MPKHMLLRGAGLLRLHAGVAGRASRRSDPDAPALRCAGAGRGNLPAARTVSDTQSVQPDANRSRRNRAADSPHTWLVVGRRENVAEILARPAVQIAQRP